MVHKIFLLSSNKNIWQENDKKKNLIKHSLNIWVLNNNLVTEKLFK